MSVLTVPSAAAPVAAPRLRRTPVTWLAYLSLCTYVFTLCGVGPSIPFLEADLRLNHSQAVLHWTMFAAGSLVSGLYAHRLNRRLGRRAVIWLGLLGSVSGGLLMASAVSLAVTLTGAVLAGLTGGVIGITVNAILADSQTGAARDATLLEAHILTGASAMLAPLALGAFALSPLGWHGAALVPVVALATLWLRCRPVRVPPQPPVQATGSGRRWPRGFATSITLAVLLSAAETSVALWAATFLQSLGVRTALASGAVAIFFGFEVTGRAIMGRLAMRPRFQGRFLLIGMCGGVGGFALFWLGGPLVVRLVGFAVVGVSFSAFYPLSTSLVMAHMGGRTDVGSARHSIAMGAGSIAVPSILAFVADRAGIATALGIVPVLLAGAFVAYAGLARGRRATPVSTPVPVSVPVLAPVSVPVPAPASVPVARTAD